MSAHFTLRWSLAIFGVYKRKSKNIVKLGFLHKEKGYGLTSICLFFFFKQDGNFVTPWCTLVYLVHSRTSKATCSGTLGINWLLALVGLVLLFIFILFQNGKKREIGKEWKENRRYPQKTKKHNKISYYFQLPSPN
jgi:hypothetical protein